MSPITQLPFTSILNCLYPASIKSQYSLSRMTFSVVHTSNCSWCVCAVRELLGSHQSLMQDIYSNEWKSSNPVFNKSELENEAGSMNAARIMLLLWFALQRLCPSCLLMWPFFLPHILWFPPGNFHAAFTMFNCIPDALLSARVYRRTLFGTAAKWLNLFNLVKGFCFSCHESHSSSLGKPPAGCNLLLARSGVCLVFLTWGRDCWSAAFRYYKYSIYIYSFFSFKISFHHHYDLVVYRRTAVFSGQLANIYLDEDCVDFCHDGCSLKCTDRGQKNLCFSASWKWNDTFYMINYLKGNHFRPLTDDGDWWKGLEGSEFTSLCH